MSDIAIEKIGKVSSKSVLKHTGKNWNQWLVILENAGAKHWLHKEIVAFLRKKYRLTVWWQQSVAYGYQLHLGKKVEGRNAKGEYSLIVTRTFPGDEKKVWKFLESKKGLAIWLKPYSEFRFQTKQVYENELGAFGEIRTLKLYRRVRMSWQETEWIKPSVLQIHLVPKPKKQKCIVVLSQEGLSSGRLRLQWREHWAQVMDELVVGFKG